MDNFHRQLLCWPLGRGDGLQYFMTVKNRRNLLIHRGHPTHQFTRLTQLFFYLSDRNAIICDLWSSHVFNAGENFHVFWYFRLCFVSAPRVECNRKIDFNYFRIELSEFFSFENVFLCLTNFNLFFISRATAFQKHQTTFNSGLKKMWMNFPNITRVSTDEILSTRRFRSLEKLHGELKVLSENCLSRKSFSEGDLGKLPVGC